MFTLIVSISRKFLPNRLQGLSVIAVKRTVLEKYAKLRSQ